MGSFYSTNFAASKDARSLKFPLSVLTSLIIHASFLLMLFNQKGSLDIKAAQPAKDFVLSVVLTADPPSYKDSKTLDSSVYLPLPPSSGVNSVPIEEKVLEYNNYTNHETTSNTVSSKNQTAIFNSNTLLTKDEAKAAIIKLAASAESKSPRSRKIVNQNHLSSSEESYLRAWGEKCEKIGRRNYPPKNIEGRATTKVVISRSGTLIEARIINTSGSSLIDKAILKTIREASPFQPFSVEMSKNYDLIEFERIWQFSKTKPIVY